jgi:hypothetical protein
LTNRTGAPQAAWRSTVPLFAIESSWIDDRNAAKRIKRQQIRVAGTDPVGIAQDSEF